MVNVASIFAADIHQVAYTRDVPQQHAETLNFSTKLLNLSAKFGHHRVDDKAGTHSTQHLGGQPWVAKLLGISPRRQSDQTDSFTLIEPFENASEEIFCGFGWHHFTLFQRGWPNLSRTGHPSESR